MREKKRQPTLAEADEVESNLGNPEQTLRMTDTGRGSRTSVPPPGAGMSLSSLPPLPDEETLTAELERDMALLREATARFEATKAWAEQDSAEEGFPLRQEKIESLGGDAWLSDDLPDADIPMDNTTHGSRGRNTARGPRPDQPSLMKDDNQHIQTAHLTTEQLEAELAKARAALKDLRDKAATQTRMYGSVGAQTRKLEQRAAELRDRVARAQQALNERAQKLQARLAEEREKLRAYQTKLKKKAEELNEANRERRRRQEAEIAALKAALTEDRAALEKREADLDARLTELEENAERELAERKAELEETLNARMKEIQRKTLDIQRRLDRREADLSEREKDIQKNQGAVDDLLKARVEQIETEAQIGRSKQNEAFEVTRQRLEEQAAAKEAELATLRESLVQHENKVARQKAELDRLRQEVENRARQMADGNVDMDRRDENLARMSAALEVRERRLMEWQRRIEDKESKLKASEETIDDQRHTLANMQEQIRDRATELDAQSQELTQTQETLDAKRRELDERDDVTGRKLADVDARAAGIEAREKELEAELAAIVDERKQYKDLTQRLEEAEKQKESYTAKLTELDAREQTLKEQLEAHERDETALQEAEESAEKLRSELDELSKQLNERERDIDERDTALHQLAAEQTELKARLDERESILNERRAKIETDEQGHTARLEAMREAELAKINDYRAQEEAKLEQQREANRRRLEEAEAAHAAEMTRLQQEREQLEHRRTSIEEAQLQLDMDRKAADELRQAAEAERAAVERERAQIETERNQVADDRRDLQTHRSELEADRERLNAEQASLESDRARIERDRISLKDRERAVAEETSRLESLKAETETARRDVQDLRDEAEALRDQLLAKAERLKTRKEQLARDAAKVDERVRELNEELAGARKERADLRGEREKLSAEMAKLQRDREQFDREREEMDQSRRTFQVGLKNLEDSQRDLADREVRLAERANELEAFRDRLEDEHAELQRQRKKVLAMQEASGDAKRNIESLMAQAEDREAEARRREESIKAHEQAISLRASELARSEEELRRDRREFEAKRAEISAEMDSIEAARNEFDGVIQREQAKLEEERAEIERELATEREALAQRDRELNQEWSRRQAAIEDAENEAAAMGDSLGSVDEQEVRRRVESEFDQRAEELRRKEEEFERRCKTRIEGLDRDIEERLAALEHEIKERRERAEAEMKDRRRTQEEELREARTRLDEQVDDLRRRQSAIAQEQSVLLAKRRDEQLEDRTADAEEADDATGTILTIDDEIEANGSAAEAPTEVVAERDTDASPFEIGASDEATGGGPAGDPATEQPNPVAAAASLRTASQDEPRGGFRPLRTVAWAVALGCLAAAIALYDRQSGVDVRGELTPRATDTAAAMSLEEHQNLLANNASQLEEKANQGAGIDLRQLVGDDSLVIEPTQTRTALAVTLRAPKEQKAAAEKWLEAYGDAYMETLSQSTVTADQVAARKMELQAGRTTKLEELSAAQSQRNLLENAMRTDPRLSGVKDAIERKDKLKRDVAAALEELKSATAALEAFEKKPPPSGPIVPTDEQLANAYATDSELMLAMQQRDARARDFHAVLLESMSQSQLPLSTLLTRIDELAAETQRQMQDQTDADIRAELEEVALDINEYREQAQEFGRDWDTLAPKVAAWRSGGDAELLLEYHQKAEDLIRAFHAASKTTQSEITRKADAIGRGGDEMTMRRVVQSKMLAAVNTSREARNEWIIAAQGVLPRYNTELLALKDAIEDLTPRVNELRRHHREQLAEHLLKAARNEHAAELEALKVAEEDASKRYQELSNEYLRVDDEATIPPALRAERDAKQAEISRLDVTIETLTTEIASIEEEIDRCDKHQNTTLAGTAAFKQLPTLGSGPLDFSRAQIAIGAGGGVGVAYVLLTWGWLRLRRRR